MLDLAEQLIREAPALVGGHGRKPATLEQLRTCLVVPVLRTLPELNRSPVQQLECLFDARLMDKLQCLTQAEVKAVMELSKNPPPHWQQMVPYLEERLLRGTGTGLSWQS